MTHQAYETSTTGGSPVELYEFQHGPNFYRYTSASMFIERLGATYQPIAIGRGASGSDQDSDKATMEIEAERTISVAEVFRGRPPSDRVRLTIWGRHLDDPDAEYVVIWTGLVLNVMWRGNGLVFSCEPVNASLDRNGLRRTYQASCPHVLYGPACKASAAAHRIIYPAGSYTISGNTVTVAGLSGGPNRYAGGYIQYLNPTNNISEYRAIRSSTVMGVLTLSLPPNGLAQASEMWVHRGCQHSPTDCAVTFGNILNYGGWPYRPGINPFGGSRIF